MVYQNVVAGFQCGRRILLYRGHVRPVPAPGPRNLERVADAGLGHRRQYQEHKNISRVVAIMIFAGFISVPISVLAGWVR